MNAQANSYTNAMSYQSAQQVNVLGTTESSPPRTIATAISGLEKINERLSNVRAHLANVCELIGGPYPVATNHSESNPIPSGAVARLNQSADSAHFVIGEIEALLAVLSFQLG